jgi:hypothetical protein
LNLLAFRPLASDRPLRYIVSFPFREARVRFCTGHLQLESLAALPASLPLGLLLLTCP